MGDKVMDNLSRFIVVWIILLIVGIFTYKQYGMSWDEQAQREIGIKFYNYVFLDDNNIEDFADKDHGSIFEIGKKQEHLEIKRTVIAKPIQKTIKTDAGQDRLQINAQNCEFKTSIIIS